MALTKVSTGMIEAGASSVDLNIDEGTLFIDASNNRVGVANVNPATALDVSGTITGTLFSGSGASLTNIPNVALDNSSITINSYSTALGGTVTLSTSDIGEGTKLYYTDARARSSISITDSGGDGSLAYDNGTGVITYTGPSAAEVRAHISAGTGVDFSSGVISIGQSVGTSDTVTFNNLTVSTTATIPYDNTISGLTATNIQSAITELNTLVGGGNIGSQANYEIYEFTATGNQTTFDISTQGSPAPSYDPGYIQVFMNGVLLSETDYTAVDGSNVVLSTGATAGQLISIITLDSFNIQELLRVTSIDASASTDSIAIDASSNVGINRQNIIQPSAGATTLAIQGTVNDKAGAIRLYSADDSVAAYIYPDSVNGLSINTSTSHPIVFRTVGSEAARIDTSGNVTINKSNFSSLPAVSKLNIFGDGVTLRLDGSSATTKSILFRNTSVANPGEMYADGSLRLRTEDANTRITFHTNSSGSDNERMRIDSNGNVGIGTTSPTEKLEVAGTSLVENAKLKAIAESNTDTAVDVFVYDTRKDSDGGAWRKRTQNTSWYNETLNTSTRGSRKEFPCVAVIVAEATQLTIYDGDDPSLPMWMIFNSSGANGVAMLGRSTESTTSVAMLNGILSVGRTSFGLHIVHFISDFAEFKEDGYDTPYALPIGTNRNSGNSWTTVNRGNDLVNDTINEVAMTVLPNALIDADTGLPVPTIAVATQGGVSIIKDDGTIVDIDPDTTGQYSPVARVEFIGTTEIAYASRNTAVWYLSPIPTSDTTYSPYNDRTGNVDRVIYGGAYSSPEIVLTDSNDTEYLTREITAQNREEINFQTRQGLNKVYRDVAEESKGLSAVIKHDYNTGWMHGDIKLATLSDTDDTDVTGSELVTNGTFDSTSDWTLSTGWSISGGKLRKTDSSNTSALQTINTVTGKTYVISVTVDTGAVGAYIYADVDYSGDILSSAGVYSRTFTATSTATVVGITGVSGTGLIADNFSVRLAEPDRSVNNNGLQVFGTVTKTAVATGADLVGYSGFSSSNYLQQPYNADLTFGTGSYSIMGWFKTDATNSTGMIAQLGPSDVDESLCVFISPSNYGIYFDYGTGSEYSYLSSADDRASIANTEWHHFVCHVSAGGIPKIYVDGIDKTITVVANAPSTFTFDTDYVLNIGNGRGTDANEPFGGSIALIKISKTIPSEKQIKKIYNDEKHLFVENAKATLYGSSDAVTSLAYDDDTELLHVGTSAGRSEFQGLRRVNNTTDAVSEAISASNGFIVED